MLWNKAYQINQRQDVYQNRILTTEERMDIAFVLVIRFSGEHAPSNEMLKKWGKET